MKGKIVLVTGANGGLGTYVTQTFLDAGATVIGSSLKIQQSDFHPQTGVPKRTAVHLKMVAANMGCLAAGKAQGCVAAVKVTTHL